MAGQPTHGALDTPSRICRAYSTASKVSERMLDDICRIEVHSSYPLMRTAFPVPPGPVFVAVKVQ